MKSKQTFKIIVIIAVIVSALLACNNSTTYNETPIIITTDNETLDNNTTKIIITTDRYETVLYTNTINVNNLVYSAHDNINNYYLFLLGHINYVPLAYRNAVIYNGQTPITIGYSQSNITERSIRQSIETAYEHSVTHNIIFNWNVSAEVGIKENWLEAKLTAARGGSVGWDVTETYSVSNTYETILSKTNGTTDNFEIAIGNNNEPTGKYRYSLFATTDVYYVLVTNRTKTEIIDVYSALCARPQASWAWGIDYDPDTGGAFGKTAEGDLLKIPLIILSELPDPTDVFNNIETNNGEEGENIRLPTKGPATEVGINLEG